jgi:hypothetical protein
MMVTSQLLQLAEAAAAAPAAVDVNTAEQQHQHQEGALEEQGVKRGQEAAGEGLVPASMGPQPKEVIQLCSTARLQVSHWHQSCVGYLCVSQLSMRTLVVADIRLGWQQVCMMMNASVCNCCLRPVAAC